MERSYTFFIGVFVMLGGISLWSQNTARAISPSEHKVDSSISDAPTALASPARDPASSRPLEIEPIDSSAP